MSEYRIIKPTIGSKLWFWPAQSHGHMTSLDDEQPMDATVVFVHPDSRVNLLVVDHQGAGHAVAWVFLRQDHQKSPDSAYCEWMPYQLGQASPVPPQQPNRMMLQYGIPIDTLTEATLRPPVQTWPNDIQQHIDAHRRH